LVLFHCLLQCTIIIATSFITQQEIYHTPHQQSIFYATILPVLILRWRATIHIVCYQSLWEPSQSLWEPDSLYGNPDSLSIGTLTVSTGTLAALWKPDSLYGTLTNSTIHILFAHSTILHLQVESSFWNFDALFQPQQVCVSNSCVRIHLFDQVLLPLCLLCCICS
jgi:hypothetical protein